MNVVVDGLMSHYQKAGKGKALVLLHGWGDSAKTFQALSEFLKNDFEVYMLDLPGFGDTQMPPTTWGTKDYALFVQHWLDKIGLKDVYGLIGHSYGGAVSVYGISENILKPHKLVLIASSGIRDTKLLQKSALRVGSKVAKLPLALLPRKSQQKIKNKLYKSIGSEAMMLPHMQETFRKIIDEDIQGAAKTITDPTLLIYGSEDKATPVAFGQKLNSEIANSRLEVIGGAGHFLHQENAEAVAGQIKEFLGQK